MKTHLLGNKWSATELLNYLKEKCPNFKYEAPIDVYKVLECLNIKLNKVEKFNDILGEIEVKNGEPIITINTFNHLYPEREKFTIAHELGHLCKHIAPNQIDKFVDTEETMKRNNNIWNFREYEANKFAARLLIPVDLLKKEILSFMNERQIDNVNELIAHLAKKFEVSKQAMRYRLKNLGIIS